MSSLLQVLPDCSQEQDEELAYIQGLYFTRQRLRSNLLQVLLDFSQEQHEELPYMRRLDFTRRAVLAREQQQLVRQLAAARQNKLDVTLPADSKEVGRRKGSSQQSCDTDLVLLKLNKCDIE